MATVGLGKRHFFNEDSQFSRYNCKVLRPYCESQCVSYAITSSENVLMRFFKKYLSLVLFFILGAAVPFCGAIPIPEKTQHQLIQDYFKDGLHYSAQEEAQAYLKGFPEGKFRENILFIKIRSDELQADDPTQFSEIIQSYQAYRQAYPKSERLEDALFSEGVLSIRLEKYAHGMELLEQVLNQFPQSSHQEEALYWLGEAAFYSAKTAREEQDLAGAQRYEEKTIATLLQIPEPNQLTPVQNIKRFYFLGWTYHFQNDPQNTTKWLLAYTNHSANKPLLARAYYQIGQNEWETNNYQSALFFFNKLDAFPEFPLRHPTLFLKAEARYQLFLENPPQENSTSEIETLISGYQDYLETQHKQYLPNAYNRLGELYERQGQSKEAMAYYQRYLQQEHSPNKAEVHYKLGQIYLKKGDLPQAIAELEKARENPTYRNSAAVTEELAQLYQATNQQKALQKLLAEAKNNQDFDPQERTYFQLQEVNVALQNNQCKKVLNDLKTLPPESNAENRRYLTYARGVCFVKAKQWKKAQADLLPLAKDPQYEKQIFDLLMVVYQETKNWPALSRHIEGGFKKKGFSPQSVHFQKLVAAHHQTQNWAKVAATYRRWEAAFPKALKDSANLVDWAQAEENLGNREKSQALYQKALALPKLDLDVRERVVAHLAEVHQKDRDYLGMIQVYETHWIPYLSKAKQQRKYTFLMGKTYYDPLQDAKNAKKWLQKTDQGGVGEWEMQAALLLARMDEENNQTPQAIQQLKDLLKRPLKKSIWNLRINYQLALLYEKEGQLKNALAHYRKVTAHSPAKKDDQKLQAYAQKRIQEIEGMAVVQDLEGLIEKKSWPAVVKKIKDGLAQKQIVPQNEIYETLVYAELQNKNWAGVLSAYAQWNKLDATKTETLPALLTQGQAAEQLGDKKQAKKFYTQALKIVPSQDLETRIALTESLGVIYDEEKDYQKVVELYEKTYPFLKKPSNQIRFAYTIGSYYATHLNQNKAAQAWFLKADQGGTSEEELSAAWQAAELEPQADKAFKLFAKMAARPLKENLKWYIPVNLQLGILSQEAEQWQKAKLYYDRVAQTPPAEAYKTEQAFAKEKSAEITAYLQQLKAAP